MCWIPGPPESSNVQVVKEPPDHDGGADEGNRCFDFAMVAIVDHSSSIDLAWFLAGLWI